VDRRGTVTDRVKHAYLANNGFTAVLGAMHTDPVTEYHSYGGAVLANLVSKKLYFKNDTDIDDDETLYLPEEFEYVSPSSTNQTDTNSSSGTDGNADLNKNDIGQNDIKSTNNSEIPKHIEGDEDLKKRIAALCLEYLDIFATVVAPEPAKIDPMDIIVDTIKWHTVKNKGAPRVQSVQAQREIKGQIDAMLHNRIIKKSQANYYSQVLLTPKPNGQWRFCIDYRNLNEATSQESSFPLPNIIQMIERIGANRPKIFGVMDLTSGYHQMPIKNSHTIFTAFICFMGIFEFLRVPFGLKGAPSFFQERMATVVLAGLLYTVCELYIDDCIVYANTNDEFIEKLRAVFARFRLFGIKLNPNKCHFGLSEIEYVGHLLNEKGHTFSRDKINQMIEMKKPIYEHELKTFIGCANYFHKHIKNLSILMKPLERLLQNYKKRSKQLVKWDTHSSKNYEIILEAIKECPRLYYIDDKAPIYLHTDACDFGIGGYLFQVIDGEERPITFLSKSLSGSQLNWSTYDKEAFALFYSVFKFRHLLCGPKFIIRTDHKNLLYVGEGGNSPKVQRWRQFLSTFNFDVEYIKGEENIAADGFSRLCVFEEYESNGANVHDHIKNNFRTPTQAFSRLCALSDPDEEVEAYMENDHIPRDLYKQIGKVHNSYDGHFGIHITYNKLQDKNIQHPKLRDYIRKYIKNCPHCQKMSELKYPIKTNPFVTNSKSPMDRINVDTIGPLPEAIDGSNYILVIIDSFSRYINLYPTKSTSALDAVIPLIHHVGLFGLPKEILSDNGTQFANELMDELTKALNIDQRFTTPYSKEENGIVERSNKEVMRHLRAIIFDKNILGEWYIYLPLVQRIINSKVHLATGVSPASIVTPGVDLNRHVMNDNVVYETTESLDRSEWMKNMIDKQKVAINVALKTQNDHESDHTISKHYDNPTIFPINSYVLVEYPESNGKKRQPNKLMTQNAGPFRVTDYDMKGEYQLFNLVNNEIKTGVSVHRLKPYNHDIDMGLTPDQVAMRDQQFFEVEKVLDHKGDIKKISTLKFLTKWKGYENSDNTWQDWKDIRSNLMLHQYLINKNLGYLIPKSFHHMYKTEELKKLNPKSKTRTVFFEKQSDNTYVKVQK